MKALCVCLLIMLAHGPLSKASAANYQIQLDNDSGLISVRACFNADRPVYLSSGMRGSDRYLVETANSSYRVSRNGRRMFLNQDCVNYQVDLSKAIRDRQAHNKGNTWLVNNRAWFWRPTQQQSLSLFFLSQHTLDQVLAKLYRCCLPSNKLWRASEFMARLDQLSQTTIFSQLLANEAVAKKFPISLSDEIQPDSQIAMHLDDIFQTNINAGKTND